MNRCCAATAATFALLVSGAAGCASDEPVRPSTASPADSTAVTVLGDGFVRIGDRRIPREAFVLELRQRARAMTAEEREATEVVLVIPHDAAAGAAADRDWLLDQLYIANIGRAVVR